MIIKPKFGSVAEIEILRRKKGGRNKIDKIGRFHNFPRNSLITQLEYISGISSSNIYFSLKRLTEIYEMEGTWQQSGDIVSRVTGSQDFWGFSDFYFFEDGTKAGYRLNGASSGQFSRSNSVSPQKLFRIRSVQGTGDQTIYSFSSAGISRTYDNGVVSMKLNSPKLSTPMTSDDIVRGLASSVVGSSNGRGTHTPLPDTPIYTGDIVVIADYEYKFDYGFYEPIEFLTSPISGLNGSGRFQYLLAMSRYITSFDFLRVWLIQDGNEWPIPNLSNNDINPNVLNPAETIISTRVSTNPSEANDMTHSQVLTCTIPNNISNVKQIAFGATNRVCGIIEYDTPVSLEAGKTLQIGMSIHLDFTVTIP